MNSSKSDFTQGSIIKKLISFMVPILGALILQAAYGAVDLLVVGRFGTTSGLSAVLFVIMVCFARPVSILMQAPEEAVALTTTYVRICGAGIFFIVAYNLLAAIFRGFGDSRSPLIFVAIACVINIIGDLVLVAGLHMDAAGAAIATVLAQAVSAIFAVILLAKRKNLFTITRQDFKINNQCGRLFKIGFPLALQDLAAPTATVVGIILNVVFYLYINRKDA